MKKNYINCCSINKHILKEQKDLINLISLFNIINNDIYLNLIYQLTNILLSRLNILLHILLNITDIVKVNFS